MAKYGLPIPIFSCMFSDVFLLDVYQATETLLLYKRGLVSLGRAAELAGISERDMIRQARAADIKPAWSA